MGEHRTRRLIFFVAAVILGVAISACSCGDLTARLSRRRDAKDATATAVELKRATTARPAAAVQPSVTATPPKPAPTSRPTWTLVPTASVQRLSEFVLPSEPNSEFTLLVTEDDLNEELGGQTYDLQGLIVEDVRLTLTSSEIIGDLQATYAQANLSAGIHLRGVPQVVDGQAYIQVTEATLDRSVTGFVRLVAQQMIATALEQYSSEHGIPIPIEGMEVLSVELQPQQMVIVGRTQD
jgi:hypothetical protein